MVDHTQAWITESNAGMQRLVLMAMLAIGLALAAASRHFDASGLSPSLSAFALGVLMLVIGAGGLLFAGKTTIRVEPRYRRIVITGSSLLRQSSDVVAFQDIASLTVEEEGDNEGGSIRYHVAAHLHSGRTLPLFCGFFDGMHDRAAMEQRRQRLLQAITTSD
jgi:hypothetical protein